MKQYFIYKESEKELYKMKLKRATENALKKKLTEVNIDFNVSTRGILNFLD